MSRIRLALAVIAVASFAPAAFADEPVGPKIGNNSYAARIAGDDGRADTDDYVASLAAGERIVVRVAAAKGSSLLPALTLVAPDGTEFVPPAIVATKGGKSVALRGYVVPSTGRWAVRVAGAQGTEGAYVVAFSITGARAVSVRHASIAGPADVLQAFDGLDGARVNVKVTSHDPKALVTIRGITDPDGAAAPGAAVVTSGRSVSVRGLVLHGGDGTYGLRLGTAAASATYDLSIKVTPQGRPASRKPLALSSFDPYLAAVTTPLRGVAGMTLRIAGSGFDPASPPTVLFGTKPAVATVAADGASLSAIVPAALDGDTVAVTVVAKDGQAASRSAYFHYVEPPAVADLLTEALAPIRALPADGGMELILRGAFFEEGQQVLFGETPAVVESVVGTTSMRIVVPSMSAGDVSLAVTDRYGRTSVSSVVVEFMNAPTIDAVAAMEGPAVLDSGHVSVDGGAVVEISGSDFHDSDVVTVNGVTAQVVSASDGTLQFIAPPGEIGPVTLVVTNAAGESAEVEKAFEYVDSVEPVIDPLDE